MEKTLIRQNAQWNGKMFDQYGGAVFLYRLWVRH